MSLQIDPPSTDSGTAAGIELTLAEIVSAFVPALIGIAGVALIAIGMLL